MFSLVNKIIPILYSRITLITIKPLQLKKREIYIFKERAAMSMD
jgi:hypothetical protein